MVHKRLAMKSAEWNNNKFVYKGSAPRAGDAARYARARKNTTKSEGGRKRPMVGATSDLMMPRAT